MTDAHRPPIVWIIAIGRELLTGRVLDKNSNFLAGRFFDMGWALRRVCLVDDEFHAVCGQIKQALDNGVDLLITTGGLGPTYDDGTLGYAGKCLGLDVEMNARAAEMVKERYAQVSRMGVIEGGNLNRARMKMAFLPRTAIPLRNEVGTAPGAWLQHENTMIACLPGPPREMQAMFENEVVTRIQKLTGGRRFVRDRITLPQPDESVLDPLIAKARQRFPDVYFKTTPHGFTDPRMDVVMETYGQPESAQKVLEQAARFLMEIASPYLPD